MMKKQTFFRFLVRTLALMTALACMSVPALAYDAQQAAGWLDQFAQALQSLLPSNDPVLTADPARAGEYLLEYGFGTARSRSSANPTADQILEIDMRTQQVTDCRGVRVGMPVEQVLQGAAPVYGMSPLYVLSTQEAGYGWSWAYVGESGVYGVEYIAYGNSGAAMKEYTLTYVVDGGVITAIRMKMADATLAQAQDGLETAEEIASRQKTDVLIAKNDQPMLTASDLTIMGGQALGVPVAQLIARMGEPLEIQTLPDAAGRVLIYDGAVATLGFNEATGEEIVRALGVNSNAYEGPNRLMVGMPVSQAGSLIRCDENVYARGGTLYLEGEALGEAPYGELVALGGGEMMLVYACQAGSDAAMLQAIARDGIIVSWQLMYQSDMQGGV